MTLSTWIEELIHHPINALSYYEMAFRHSSYVNEQRDPNIKSNERLEFLGDAVLELIVSRYLYHYCPDWSEGELTRTRAQLVREDTLAYLTTQLQLDDHLLLGQGESNSGRQRPSILADLFEAFLGAVYLDLGLEVAEQFLIRVMLNNHQELLQQANQDFKTLLQEKLQQRGSIQIRYELLGKQGPAHNSIFKMGLYVNDQFVSQGTGKSKKNAEMAAAKEALKFVDETGQLHVPE